MESVIKKVGLDQDARYKREETDLAVRETAQLTVKPRLSSLRRMHAWECVVVAKAELQKISDVFTEYKPDEDVRPGGAHGESQGKSPRGSGSQPGGAKVQVHIRGCVRVDV